MLFFDELHDLQTSTRLSSELSPPLLRGKNMVSLSIHLVMRLLYHNTNN